MAQTRIQTNSRHVTYRMSHIACHVLQAISYTNDRTSFFRA